MEVLHRDAVSVGDLTVSQNALAGDEDRIPATMSQMQASWFLGRRSLNEVGGWFGDLRELVIIGVDLEDEFGVLRPACGEVLGDRLVAFDHRHHVGIVIVGTTLHDGDEVRQGRVGERHLLRNCGGEDLDLFVAFDVGVVGVGPGLLAPIQQPYVSKHHRLAGL